MNFPISEPGIDKELARRSLLDFTTYTMINYEVNWHHKLIADKLTYFSQDKINKLILTVPPQHGKSELASRRLPAYLLGLNPDLRIAGCSYNETFASKFNRQIQRIITSNEYKELFPDTKLNDKNISTYSKGNYLRNSKEFEIVDYVGSYISVGTGGGITGNPVDILIIDDPIKGREEANSAKYRNNLWEWYTDEALTRLHNNSQQLIIMTRWHEDDLVGRILAQEPDEWQVINFPALKENNDNKEDPRKIGESLWEDRHSKENLLKKKRISSSFNSLFQGNPTTPEGNKIKSFYFEVVEKAYLRPSLVWNLFIDGAYTKNTQNDPTGLLVCAFDEQKNELIIKISIDKYLEMPELLKYLRNFTVENEVRERSRIYIEPKASGLTMRQLLNEKKYNAVDIKHKYVNVSKIERVDSILPTLESMKVKIVKGYWNNSFLSQCKQFPNSVHDEHVDNLCYAVIQHFILTRKRKMITNLDL